MINENSNITLQELKGNNYSHVGEKFASDSKGSKEIIYVLALGYEVAEIWW